MRNDHYRQAESLWRISILLWHILLLRRNGKSVIWKLKSSRLSYMEVWNWPPFSIDNSKSRLEAKMLLSIAYLISSSTGYIWRSGLSTGRPFTQKPWKVTGTRRGSSKRHTRHVETIRYEFCITVTYLQLREKYKSIDACNSLMNSKDKCF